MPYTIVHRTRLDAARAESKGLAPLPPARGLFETAGRRGVLESPPIETPAPFDDLVASWNAELPAGAALEVHLQALTDRGWSAWYLVGRQEPEGFASPPAQADDDGAVDIDTLKLKRPATAFRYRATLTANGKPAVLRLIAVSASAPESPPEPPPPSRKPLELKVKPRSQMVEQDDFKNDICSPTALAMALEFWGKSFKTAELAARVRDKTTGKYGVWPFNAAAAGQAGLEGWVARLGSLNDIEDELAAGRPVVVSLSFTEGELAGAPLKKTRGHLLLVAGFTDKGDVIALDPAAPTAASARRVYQRRQFHKAWRVNKRGLAYLAGPLLPRRMAVGVPFASLWSTPGERKKPDASDPEHLSQLLYGEEVMVHELKGDWARVQAVEQEDFLEKRKWQGYPGWVHASALRFLPAPPSGAVVRTRQALLHAGEDLLVLSVGTRLMALPDAPGNVMLLDGRRAKTEPISLYAPSPDDPEIDRPQVIKTAELFLGASYYWGGRSGVQPDPALGVDCSGLTSLAYRLHGIDIPRDAHEQMLKGRALKRARLLPGDLIFLSDSLKSRIVTHVMLYTGGDAVIESRKSSGKTLRSTFSARFKKPLSEIESGDVVTDYSLAKPRQRIVTFGTYFEAGR